MTQISDRYRRRADDFERKVTAVRPEQWSNPSPCSEWTARDVVQHIIDMHGVMLRPVDRALSAAPAVDQDPLAAFRAARADVEALLADDDLLGVELESPVGRRNVAQYVDEVASDDLPIHGWDLAKATGLDTTIHPEDVRRLWDSTTALGEEMLHKLRVPEAFGPGVFVFGPEVPVPQDAPLQDRLLGMLGRDPSWT